MSQFARSLKKLLFISVPSVLIILLALEIAIRLFLNASDPRPKPFYDPEYQIQKLTPNRSGTYIEGNLFSADFNTNNAGWNSTRDYEEEKTEDIRIAVIGDSYVQGRRVDIDKNFFTVLENYLNEHSSKDITVYSFGFEGAPLSQYLHMMRYISEVYKPDIYIINMVDNDFDESLISETLWPYHMQFDIDSDGTITEILPTEPEQELDKQVFRFLANSTLFRYAMYNGNMFYYLTSLQDSLEENEVGEGEFSELYYEGQRDILESVVTYAFQGYLDIANATDSKLLLVHDGIRDSIYVGLPAEDDNFYAYHQATRKISEELSIAYLDLHATFEADYAENGQTFNIKDDEHWNVYGNLVVGTRIGEEILSLSWLDDPEEQTD